MKPFELLYQIPRTNYCTFSWIFCLYTCMNSGGYSGITWMEVVNTLQNKVSLKVR